ncbi:hypothetical protein ASPZODRAFT_169125 [Penicilliopsis zonata CBS 506.65]|uniref:Far11/STRP C-terminal domain-containing protein n=1 Tax=Penicilliopsis zonata CBS 506.65 TaxID=1073090 RepID=A0A1L9S9K1_9EURO|nr:hypothetical protein ASPZODRAFT_169125 [Penicilliopsis zonata CBS 506.65]OJJ43836.1 hypothetical protein ASPZODRAFT_169125 [Penicilliopsis zonata CBS 506.65]
MMEDRHISQDTEIQEQHIVKADEVDQTGTDINPVSDEQLLEEVAEGLRQEAISVPDATADNLISLQAEQSARRPVLRRDGSAPPPPLQPPPPAPVQQSQEQPSDSLSLVQLRRLAQDLPRVEQRAYAFEYADAQPFPDELEEWFQYSEFDRVMLMGAKFSFDNRWRAFSEQRSASSDSQEETWLDASYEKREQFINELLHGLRHDDLFTRLEALESISYIITGIWGVTAGIAAQDYPVDPSPQMAVETPKFKSLQIKWIEENVSLIQQCDGFSVLLEYFYRVFEKNRVSHSTDSDGATEHDNPSPAYVTAIERESNLILTALYFIVEVGRRQESSDPHATSVRNALSMQKPSLLVFLVEIIARLRWDDSTNVPLTRVILLFWKSLLLLFGGSESLKKVKEELEPPLEARANSGTRRTPFLTASPLDYHSFRQEITSKYPAYNPPPPIVPLELENNSILPPLPQHLVRTTSSNGLFSGVGPSVAGGNGSILHQSVHIATPAPSPPPSPIGPGGKAGKKQNYQTNQNFPFMYPPLDTSSNDLGGKGTTEMQDLLVGKKWEGSDVPASIIEAGQLFSTHVKLTRAMRQLWEERERFMKYDRGWNLGETSVPSDGFSINGLDEDIEHLSLSKDTKLKPDGNFIKETVNEDTQKRLDEVESFYAQALPHLQSITIVFLKIILTNVSAMVNQANGQNGHSMSNGYGMGNGLASAPNGDFSGDFNSDAAVEELDNIRLREITGKAVSGSLLLLLKWFKRSHILKFEYMTQLLLDSNYLPLILKMFAHQDVDRYVAQKNDSEELGFFHFCHLQSNQPPKQPKGEDGQSVASEDEAAPPPIRRHPQSRTHESVSARGPSPEEPVPEFFDSGLRPEVDELGYPTAPPPKEPITTYSFRNFFSAINYLHIMQKITRDKAHRCLLLVQYKSSAILRKGLKIPDPHLRFYTLKLFKSQVPYCGRKWRQSNMRVITAIYLYCRPELRDDWLAGSDVDAEVEEALPLEQALRGLTHWWHLRQYKDVMGGDERAALMETERDFFTRELEAMGWGTVSEEMINGNGMGEEADLAGAGGPTMNGTEWDGGPLQMEGW